MKQGFDYVGVTAVFFCHDGKGKLLLHQRSQTCRDEKGRWDSLHSMYLTHLQYVKDAGIL